MRRTAALFIVATLVAGVASADVRTEEKSQVKFEGGLGRMMSIFGGKAAREGIVSTVAVKGDRKMTTSDRTGQIIDLAEEKIYELDFGNKTYKVMTFADLRRQFEEARRRAAEQTSREEAKKPDTSNAPQYEMEVSVKESGQSKAVNGFDAHEVVTTITVHEKGKTLEQNGGMMMTTSTWLAPNVPNVKDVAEFDRRFAEKLALPTLVDAQQMAAAMAMYPMMADAMKRMQVENVKFDGMPVLTVSKMETQAAPGSQPQEKESAKEEPQPAPRSLGGLGGALARRALKKDKDSKDSKEADASAAAAAPGRATVMTIQHEILKVTPSATDADVALPAGFKQKS